MEEWDNLEPYLSRFKAITPPESSRKIIIQESIEKFTAIFIELASVKIQGTKVFLNISPIQKNTILLYKAQILEYIQKNFPKIEITDII